MSFPDHPAQVSFPDHPAQVPFPDHPAQAEAARPSTGREGCYRRFPGVTSVVAALMTREFGALLSEIGTSADDAATARERLVAAGVRAAARLAGDPLLTSVLDRDAELLLPYLTERVGSTQRLAEKFVVAQLSAGHADGSIRPGPLAAQARVFFLTVRAFVISHRPATSDVPASDLLAELAAQLDHGLAAA